MRLWLVFNFHEALGYDRDLASLFTRISYYWLKDMRLWLVFNFHEALGYDCVLAGQPDSVQ